MKKFFENAVDYAIGFIRVVIIFVFVFKVIVVEGDSMLPTMHSGDRLIVSGLFYTPEIGDIVVTDYENGYGNSLIKRVIGVGGDKVKIDYGTGSVYINGEALDEEYILEKMESPGSPGDSFEITVPEGYVFLMGDNRNNSYDSRNPDIGPINEKNIIGRALIRIWPISRFGFI